MEAGKARALEAERLRSAEERESAKLRHEVERGKKSLDQLRVAATQEAKRLQIKLDKISAAPRHALPHFELLNPIAPGTMAPAAPGPLPLLEAGIRDLDALRASALEEAEAFRHVVVGIANGLQEALAWSEGREAERILLADFFEMDTSRQQQARSWTAHPSIADIKLKRMLEDVRDRLSAGPVHATRKEEEEEDPEAAARERERQRMEADLRDRVKDLEVEVGIARAKEQEAQKVVEEMARQNASATVPSTTDFADQKLRDELVRQKRLLDAERDEITRAQVLIQEERLSLEQERRRFDERREEELAAAMREREREREEEAKRKAEMETDSDDEPTPGHGHDHRPARPSPLSPHRKQRHVKKRPRPSLQRLVVEKQHHARAAGSSVSNMPLPHDAPTSAASSSSAGLSAASTSTAPPSTGSTSTTSGKRTPPPDRVLTEGGEKANSANSRETPMLGGARLLKAGVTLRRTSADRPRKKQPTKPPVSGGIKAVKRTPDSARKPTLEAAGIRKSAGSRSSTGSNASAASAGSTASEGGVGAGVTPSQRRLLAGTAASNAKAKKVEVDRSRPGNVWK